MDELEFRRTLYADPHCTDDKVLAAIADDPKKQAFSQELKQLEIGRAHV
jgi:t-SNARE complex subunit (syntaxin)